MTMAIDSRRLALIMLITVVLVIPAGLPMLPQLRPAWGAQVTSKASGLWAATTTWSCGCVPGLADTVTILAGHTVTVAGTGVAGKLVVQGVLKASRAASSTLTLAGNLIVEGNGVLDYGTTTSPIPVTVTSRIRWTLNEARYVGGDTMAPLDSDVGLWVVDDGKVQTNGPDRGAWTLLTSTAAAGAVQIVVDPRYAGGWRAGDEIVIGPTNAFRSDRPAVGTNLQDERRTIVSVSSSGVVVLNAPLTYLHKVEDIPWTDTFGDAYTERLAPPVANLTRNIIFEAVDPLNRPHAMFMDEAVADLSDAAFVSFGPAPKNIGKFSNGKFKPFSRYALHFHRQKDASRVSKLDSVVISGGAGRGLTIHDSYGITAYDVVIYDQAHTAFDTGNQAFWLESAVNATTGESVPKTGANDLWLDRPLAMKFGVLGSQRATGIHFGAGMGAQIFGGYAAESIGNLSAGMFWPDSTACANGDTACRDDPNRGVRGFRLTAHSSTFAFAWWNNSKFPDHIVDLLGWNSEQGIDFGAYHTRSELFQVRLIGNTDVQDAHYASGYKATGFLMDARSGGGGAIRAGNHHLAPVGDDLYENGVIRGANVALEWECVPGAAQCGEEVNVQLSRVRFEGNPLLSFIWHAQSGSYWRIRNQQGLLRPANFTLYRKDRILSGSVYDAAYDARRVDNDTAGNVLPPPRVRLLQGSGCVSDEAVVTTGSITVCAETDAPTVEFYLGKDLIARVGASGTAQTTFNMGTFAKKRAYIYAKAIAANGRYNYSRVLRVVKASASLSASVSSDQGMGTPPSLSPSVAPARAPSPRPAPTVAPARAPSPRPTPTVVAPRAPSPVQATPTPRPAGSPRAAVVASNRPSGQTTSSGISGVPAALFVVQAAVVESRQDALRLSATLRRAGFSTYLVPSNGRFAVRLGAFRERQNALRLARQAAAKGFDVVIIPLSSGGGR